MLAYGRASGVQPWMPVLAVLRSPAHPGGSHPRSARPSARITARRRPTAGASTRLTCRRHSSPASCAGSVPTSWPTTTGSMGAVIAAASRSSGRWTAATGSRRPGGRPGSGTRRGGWNGPSMWSGRGWQLRQPHRAIWSTLAAGRRRRHGRNEAAPRPVTCPRRNGAGRRQRHGSRTVHQLARRVRRELDRQRKARQTERTITDADRSM